MPKSPDKPAPTAPGNAAAQIASFGVKPLRAFALGIALPAFGLYVLSIVVVIALLASMVGEIDRIEDSRGITAMYAALDTFLNDLAGSVSDEGTWDEAYLNVVIQPDPAWMDNTWGATVRLGRSYDNVLVTDQSGAIVFGEDGTGPIEGNITSRYPAAAAMLLKLDKGIIATTDATTVSGFATDHDGTAGLAAISIHKTHSQIAVPREARRILWISRHLTTNLLQDMAVRYQTPLPQLTTTVDPGASSIDLSDADGKVAGTLAWHANRPGVSAFNHAVLMAALVFLVMGALLAFGLRMLRRAMLRRLVAVASPHVAAVGAVAKKITSAPSAARRTDDRPADLADPELTGPIDGITAAAFSIEYQPIFDLRAQTMLGVDVLLRWTRPDGSLLLQEELTPFNRARLFDRIGPLAIRHATGEIAPLLGLTLTLSVTPTQLLTTAFVEKIVGTLAATKFPAQRLQLAIDAPLLPGVAQLREPIADLRQRGILIALNEFAIGSAAASYLDARLADRARLSKSLVANLESGPTHDAYLAASIDTAHAAGLTLAATGIERKEQASRLLRQGCREFQGALLAPPMPIAALAQLVLAPAKPAELKRAS
ncbi:MAG: EAL domain-containing protein [Devosia sp.]